MSDLIAYEKPTCTTCQRLAALLHERGVEFTRVNYFTERLTEGQLRDLLAKAGLRPRDVVRIKEEGARELPLDNDDVTLRVLVARPELLQRPIVDGGDRAMLARPPEKSSSCSVSLRRMAHEGQELIGRNGFRLKFVRMTDDVLEMEAFYSGQGGLPPEHFHPHQDEHFEVLEGAVSAVIEGEHRRYVAGDTFDIPARTAHQMAGDGVARVHWEVRPPMRTPEFFERAYSDDPGDDFLDTFRNEFQLTN